MDTVKTRYFIVLIRTIVFTFVFSEGKYEIESLGEKFAANVFLKSPFDPENKRIMGIY